MSALAVAYRTVPQLWMNKIEAAYAAHLECCKSAGEIRRYEFEGMKFRLAEGAYYTPDFIVRRPNDTLECHEVKGFWREAARVRIKVAAEQWPEFRWCAVQRTTAKDRRAGMGEWKREWFN